MPHRPGAPRSIVALILSALLVLLVTACGSGDAGTPGVTATAPTGGSGPGATAVAGPGSGAKARIVNLYVPATGAPGPVEVYLKPFALEGDTPAFSVPYGEIGTFFDPDPDGDTNVFLSVYRPGVTGNGNSIMSWTDTVATGDVTTSVLATGPNTDSDGNRFGQTFEFDHGPAGQLAVPSAGLALLVVNAAALENVIPDLGDSYLFVSTGQGCAPAYYDTADTRSLLGRQLEYQLPPTTTTISIHRYPADESGFADCSNTPLLADVPVAIGAAGPVLLLLYAPNVDEYRTMLVPLEP